MAAHDAWELGCGNKAVIGRGRALIDGKASECEVVELRRAVLARQPAIVDGASEHGLKGSQMRIVQQ